MALARDDTFQESVDDFIQSIFGQEWPNAWVTGFGHDPAASSADGKVQAIAWGGAPYHTARPRIRPDYNNYLCISTFHKGEDGRIRRRTALHDATYALMIDDVGEKVLVARIKLAPTFKIQTSPHSQQWWYVLAEPERDGRRVKAVIDNLINAGLMTDNRDPGMRGVNRYGRLPFGVNTKAKYKTTQGNFPGVALQGKPAWNNRPTLLEFCTAFGISSEAQPLGEETSRPPLTADAEAFNKALLAALVAEGLYKEDRGAGKHDITCPWVHEHTGGADNGAAIFEAGYVDTSTGEIYPLGGYKCHHGHGEVIHLKMIAQWLRAKGYAVPHLTPGRMDAADEFAGVPVPIPNDELLALPIPKPPSLPDHPVVIGRYEPSDVANAYRLITIAGGRLRYHVDTGKWVYFDGARWGFDRNGGFPMLCEAVGTYITKLAAEASKGGMDLAAKELNKWALSSRMSARISAMEEHVKRMRSIPIYTRDADSDPFLFGVANGVVDLRTGCLLPADSKRLVLANCGVNFESNAEAPDWEPFVRSILEHADGSPDDALVSYTRLFLGYCLTGFRTHELFTILYGSGTNGKSTLLSVLERSCGDYGRRVRPALFEVNRGFSPGSGSATPEIAALPGARLVMASETGEGARLNMELVKQMTGDDLSARHLYREEFQFTPTFKMLFSTNHLPIVTGTDNATWRRLHPIPFDRKWRLPTDAPGVNVGWPNADLTLRNRLLAQLPGILRWLIEAARDYLAGGESFGPIPSRVLAAQMEYRTNSDVIGTWVHDYYEFGPTYEVQNPYRHYVWYCETNGLRAISGPTFSRSMQERGFNRERRGGEIYYKGLRQLGEFE